MQYPTPEEALQFLDAAAASAPLNRQAHMQVQAAVMVLNGVVQAAALAAAEAETEPPDLKVVEED